jgi:hypothetical protein
MNRRCSWIELRKWRDSPPGMEPHQSDQFSLPSRALSDGIGRLYPFARYPPGFLPGWSLKRDGWYSNTLQIWDSKPRLRPHRPCWFQTRPRFRTISMRLRLMPISGRLSIRCVMSLSRSSTSSSLLWSRAGPDMNPGLRATVHLEYRKRSRL